MKIIFQGIRFEKSLKIYSLERRLLNYVKYSINWGFRSVIDNRHEEAKLILLPFLKYNFSLYDLEQKI
jgi:hypothetical protein